MVFVGTVSKTRRSLTAIVAPGIKVRDVEHAIADRSIATMDPWFRGWTIYQWLQPLVVGWSTAWPGQQRLPFSF